MLREVTHAVLTADFGFHHLGVLKKGNSILIKFCVKRLKWLIASTIHLSYIIHMLFLCDTGIERS